MKTITKKVVANICATSQLFFPCAVRIIASFTLILLGLWLMVTWCRAADIVPPMPPQPNPMGRQFPYITVVSVQCTSIVTTAYTLKKLRTIEVIDAGLPTQRWETNFVTMGTNSSIITYTNWCGPNP